MPRLTTRYVETVKPTETRREIPDEVVSGLYLVVQPSGMRTWAVRYRVDGKSKKLTLGPYPRIELAAARNAARQALDLVSRGIDPAAHREAEKRAEAERRANNFEAVAREFIERYAKAAQPRSWRQTERTFERHLFPPWGKRPFTSIRRRDLYEILDALDAEMKSGAKHHVVAAVTKLFNWAVDREIIEASPFARMQRPKVRKRERTLTDEEIVILWQACEASESIFARLVQLLLLTGARRNEIAHLRWPEVDEAERVIVLSSDRTKAGRVHLIPLSPLASEVLARLPRFTDREYVFGARTAEDKPIAGFSKLKKLLDESMNEPFDYDLHDLRRTFRTGLSRLRIPKHVSEQCLGHAQSGLEETYDRWSYLSEKREAVEAWAGFVQRLVTSAANVVTLHRSAPAITGSSAAPLQRQSEPD